MFKEDFFSYCAVRAGMMFLQNYLLTYVTPRPMIPDCLPNVKRMLAAMADLDGATSFNMTPAGNLQIVKGKLRVTVPCVPASAAIQDAPDNVEGIAFENYLEFYAALKALEPFIYRGETPKAWLTAIAFEKGRAYATDGIACACWLKCPLPIKVPFALPLGAVSALLTIQGVITHAALSLQHGAVHTITFYFADGSRLHARTLAQPYPITALRAILFGEGAASVDEERGPKFRARRLQRAGELAAGAARVAKHLDEKTAPIEVRADSVLGGRSSEEGAEFVHGAAFAMPPKGRAIMPQISFLAVARGATRFDFTNAERVFFTANNDKLIGAIATMSS